jgi:hypothetical protein
VNVYNLLVGTDRWRMASLAVEADGSVMMSVTRSTARLGRSARLSRRIPFSGSCLRHTAVVVQAVYVAGITSLP